MAVSFKRHLLFAGLFFLAALAFIGYRNWDTVSVMLENASALNEGGSAASEIRSPDDLLGYLADNPEMVSIAVFDAGGTGASGEADSTAVFVRTDTPRPVTALPKLLVTAEYHRRIATGQLNPDRPVPLDSVAVFALPGVTADNHRRAVDSLRARGLVRVGGSGADSTVALRHWAGAALRMGDGAAMDWMLADWGREAVRAIPQRFGLNGSSAPQPATGTYLTWTNTRLDQAPQKRLTELQALSRDSLLGLAFQQVHRLRADTAYRRAEHERLLTGGSGLTLRQQREFALATYPTARASDYARFLAGVAQGSLDVPATAGTPAFLDRLQQDLERPVRTDSVETAFSHLASKSGAYPGLLAFAGYARRSGDRPPRVVVMTTERLPLAVLYHLLQTGIDKGFQLQLLADDAYAQQVRQAFENRTGAGEG